MVIGFTAPEKVKVTVIRASIPDLISRLSDLKVTEVSHFVCPQWTVIPERLQGLAWATSCQESTWPDLNVSSGILFLTRLAVWVTWRSQEIYTHLLDLPSMQETFSHFWLKLTILWNSIALTSIVVTELAYTIKYGGGGLT